MKWIKTKDILPDEDTDVVVFNTWNGMKRLAYMHFEGTYQMWYSSETGDMINLPTHWLELPLDPKRDE